MARISIGQQKILDRFKRLPGATLKFDQQIGRYRFYHEGKVIDVDQRPIEVMLRTGIMEKSTLASATQLRTPPGTERLRLHDEGKRP